MTRPPRNALKDRLVNSHLLYMAYGQLGVAHTAAGFFLYFVVMAEHGWWPPHLVNIRNNWDDETNNVLEDSYGQEWSVAQRNHLLLTCDTAFFLAIVQVPVLSLILYRRHCGHHKRI
jgi:hypothetical protein